MNMRESNSHHTFSMWFAAFLLVITMAGCGGGDPVLGSDGATLAPGLPIVTAVTPLDNAIGVPINASVSATFSEAMAPISGAATFKVTCAAPCVSPTGTVALDTSGTIATFTPATTLAPLTPYTATVTDAASLATGLVMASPYVWYFTTGATANLTHPTVIVTSPVTSTPGPTLAVPSNTAITATFSEDMAPGTITATSFTVTCAAPCVTPVGVVTYNIASRTAIFTPPAALAVGQIYTATVTDAATDTAGNKLAGNQAASPAPSNYEWSFSTIAAAPPGHIVVLSTNPTANSSTACPSATVNATFTVPNGLRMNPNTLNANTFTLTGPSPATTPVVAASVTLDAATGTVATFTPQTALAANSSYTATLIGGAAGVADLALPPDDMLANFTWTFTTAAATGNCLAPVPLLAASTFGDFGGTAGMTNQGTLTVVNGDIGTIATANSSITGFNDTAGDIYTETPLNIGVVNGTIYSCTNSTTGPNSAAPSAPNCSLANQALLDAQKAYLALAAMPVGANPGSNLGGLTLTPGVYTAPSGSFMIEGGNLTLNAQGNANAVFVFQMATSLTVGGPGAADPESIILAGGAQAKNVFWQVGSFATINAGGGGTMVGTIISQAGASFSTAGNVAVVTLDGRALSLISSVTLVNTVINVPAP
jgi:Ice-binding-like/Bacterial Ig-like domain